MYAAVKQQSDSGLFELIWGLGATGFGVIIAANHRGAAERFVDLAGMASSFRWVDDPEHGRASAGRSLPRARRIAAVFAIAGPVAIFVGALDLLKGNAGPARIAPVSATFMVWLAVCYLVTMVIMWRRPGMLREVWRGGGMGRAAAGLLTVALSVIPVAVGMGQSAVALIAWLIGGGAVMVLLLRSDRTLGR